MNRKNHAIVNFWFTTGFLLIFNFLFFDFWSIPKSLILCMLVTFAGPDSDIAMNLPHRNWFFHSCIFPILFTISFWGIPQTSFICFPWGLHLLCDISQSEGKRRMGTYLIHFNKERVLTSEETIFWLCINGFICIAFSLILEVV